MSGFCPAILVFCSHFSIWVKWGSTGIGCIDQQPMVCVFSVMFFKHGTKHYNLNYVY